jgi:hypothetical protein
MLDFSLVVNLPEHGEQNVPSLGGLSLIWLSRSAIVVV